MITLIAAIAYGNVIGLGNSIPWHLPEDFRHFCSTTKNHPVVMGSRTWDSLPRSPLAFRTNIVVTRTVDVVTEMADASYRVPTIEAALELGRSCEGGDEIFIIGGAQIYALAMPMASRLIISHVDSHTDGDTWFPEIDSTWCVHSVDVREGFTITDYRKSG